MIPANRVCTEHGWPLRFGPDRTAADGSPAGKRPIVRRIRKVNGGEIGKVGGTLRRLRVFNRDFGDAGSAVRAAPPE